jgi:hypothetical protein
MAVPASVPSGKAGSGAACGSAMHQQGPAASAALAVTMPHWNPAPQRAQACIMSMSFAEGEEASRHGATAPYDTAGGQKIQQDALIMRTATPCCL